MNLQELNLILVMIELNQLLFHFAKYLYFMNLKLEIAFMIIIIKFLNGLTVKD